MKSWMESEDYRIVVRPSSPLESASAGDSRTSSGSIFKTAINLTTPMDQLSRSSVNSRNPPCPPPVMMLSVTFQALRIRMALGLMGGRRLSEVHSYPIAHQQGVLTPASTPLKGLSATATSCSLSCSSTIPARLTSTPSASRNPQIC